MPGNKTQTKNKTSALETKSGTKRKRRKSNSRIKRDITAVVLIALGLIIGVGLFVEDSGIAIKAFMSVIFGVFGLGGYAFPFVLFGIGLYMLITAKKTSGDSKAIIFALLLVFSLLNLISLLTDSSITGVNAWEFYVRAYSIGAGQHLGGGFVGALLPYLLLTLIGKIGAYIFVCSCILIFIILISRFSIGEAAQNAIESSRQKRRERVLGADFDADNYDDEKEESGTTLNNLLDYRESRRDSGAKKSSALLSKGRLPKLSAAMIDETHSGSLYPEGYAVERAETDDGIVSKKKPKQEASEEPVITYIPPKNMHTPTIQQEQTQPTQAATAGTSNDGAKLQQSAVTQETNVTSEPEASAVPQYNRPPLSLLKATEPGYMRSGESVAEQGKLLVDTLANFGIETKIVNISVGPVITRFELQPGPGIRINRITNLADNIALALAAKAVHIEAPIPGKSAVGIEIPNKNTATVLLRDIIESEPFQKSKSPIAFAIGKDIAGAPMIGDLERMPHLLIAGSTGSGKSVCINDIILSFVYKSSPNDLRLILIDPKVVELSIFSTLPHLMMPVITDPKRASSALKWATHEMDKRYQKFAKHNARDLNRYNAMQENPEDVIPRLVIIIDELADLMLVAAKDVEDSINRIAALGRACGIHLIVSTQSPRVDVITGTIKANIPSRIALKVASQVDSRVILDSQGAEKLLGYGDLLFHPNGSPQPTRCQAAYVSDEEVEGITDYFANSAQIVPSVEKNIEEVDSIDESADPAFGKGKQEDELLPDAVRVCIETGVASISLIQRKLRVGYARAARLIDIMEEKKYVSGFEGSKARKVLITQSEFRKIFENSGGEQEDAE